MADRPGPPPQLFVVSAARDRDWVHGYLLPELGLPAAAVVTFDDFTPGTPLAAAVEQAITAARYVVLVLTPAFLDDAWSELGELLASHAQVAGGGGMVPLLLEPCQLPLPVEFRVRLDCTSRARWAAEVGRLRQLLDRPEPPAERIPCPYPGLVAFGEDQAELFFGRAAEVETLARRLPRQSRQMVIGPSGSGKTSLVFAGLLPRLAAAGDAGGWLVRSLRPGAAPAKALAEALDGWDGQRPARRLLLVVDQLEERASAPSCGTSPGGGAWPPPGPPTAPPSPSARTTGRWSSCAPVGPRSRRTRPGGCRGSRGRPSWS